MTKILTVRVPPTLLSKADAKAAQLGMDRTQYVRHLIESDLAEERNASAGRFKSEDLAGRFRLGGVTATNAEARRQWQKRLRRHETDR